MKHLSKKMMVTGLSLLLSIVVLAVVSYAWYTISVTPETNQVKAGVYTDRAILVSADGENFSEYISLTDCFANLIGLHPVSTADGMNWFLPAYQVEGMLMEAKEFILDDRLTYANVTSLDENGEPLTGDALNDQDKKGYYYYVDFFLKTELEEGCTVHLSFPEADDPHDKLTEEGVQGTYVLTRPALKADEYGEQILKESNGGENCIRVGFLMNPAYSEDKGLDNTGYSDVYQRNLFMIYEPNADARTSSGKPGSGEQDQAGRYILGNDYSPAIYADGNYLETKPIGIRTDSLGRTIVEPMTINPTKLIIQKSSAWDDEQVLDALKHATEPDSLDIRKFGYFVDTASVYEHLQTAGTAARFANIASETGGNGSESLIRLVKDEPLKIRMFIWLEGQDPDCWNDVAGSTFRLNLEFTGRE